MNVVPETAQSEVPSSWISVGFGGGKNVDIVGVTGSIPVTPTIQINHLAENDVVTGRFNEPHGFVPGVNQVAPPKQEGAET